MTFLKVVPVRDCAIPSRGGEDGQPQFDYARHDAGAPRPAPRTARDRQHRPSAHRASPGPPRTGDPFAPRARAPSLILPPLTACACSTPLQASTSADSAPRGQRDAVGGRSAIGRFWLCFLQAAERGRRAAGRVRLPVGLAGRPRALSIRARRDVRQRQRRRRAGGRGAGTRVRRALRRTRLSVSEGKM